MKLSDDDLNEVQKESPLPEAKMHMIAKSVVPADVQLRYNFSKYIIDPNKHRFPIIIRIVAYVIQGVICMKQTF